MAMLPMVLAFLMIPVMIRKIPMISATGASVDGWKNRRMDVCPDAEFRSRRRMICPVTVVPTFAPTITPSD